MKENLTAAKNTPKPPLLTRDNRPELGDDSWQMLQIFSVYRCLLSSAFFILNAMHAGTVGQEQPLLYVYILLIYFLVSIIYVFNAFSKHQSYYSQVTMQIMTDIIALTLIMHTSGGLPSGLNILYLPVIAAASVLMPGKNSFLFAAIATIAVLSEQLYAYLLASFKNNNTFTLAGLTGISLFATAIAVNMIYQRLKLSQNLGKEYIATIAKFEQIIALVLNRMPTGILVIDQNNNITMINQAAQKLLITSHLPQQLLNNLQQWRTDPDSNTESYNFEFNYNNNNIAAQFVSVVSDKSATVIIMLDDLSAQEKQAQNLKLISLGRLTASIAHEIRNPLNAISHSTQLLAESNNLNTDESRLLNIIQNNTERTNKIIESVLLLSKSKPIAAQKIHLQHWLQKFINQFSQQDPNNPVIDLQSPEENISIFFDPTHLQQIMTNLCENGIRYSIQHKKEAYLSIQVQSKNQQVYVDILDKGPGIDPENIKFLFEPFFTTENTGTGLGLFVAKELCRANGAKLEYNKLASVGSCFRVYFPTTNKSGI
jgi:two-component system sensor histidine kinase PilS (NtrC family)